MKNRQSRGTSSPGDEADIKDEAVSLCHAEFKPEINWLERKAPCFWVEAVTFRANQEVNYIIKIYENDSDRKSHLPAPLLIPPKKANWIKWCFIRANYGVHIGSFREKKSDWCRMKEAANTKRCNLTKWKMGPLCPEAPLLVE